jgi:hypothetical protein
VLLGKVIADVCEVFAKLGQSFCKYISRSNIFRTYSAKDLQTFFLVGEGKTEDEPCMNQVRTEYEPASKGRR